MEQARQHWATRGETVAEVARFLHWTTSALADQMGMTRPTVTSRLKGTTNMERWELPGFAAVLGVPVEVLELDPKDAVRWVLDNGGVDLRNRCYAHYPLVAA